ncbi:MAG: ribonuclease [Pseudomonadota bacterium]
MKRLRITNISARFGITLLVVGLSLLQTNKEPKADEQSADYVLAVTWQPAFCEGAGERPECRSQTKDRFDAANLTLHGLWPQPRDNWYCGVTKQMRQTDELNRWQELPRLELSSSLRSELKEKMPGYVSDFHRHEWVKHGTCMPGKTSPQTYFQSSLDLLDQLNASEFTGLLRKYIGAKLTTLEMKEVFSDVFGQGAGKRLVVRCKRDGNRKLIFGFRIFLRGDLQVEKGLAQLIQNSQSSGRSCRDGLVDPVGLQ